MATLPCFGYEALATIMARGFTLLELMVVLVIGGTITGLAVSGYGRYQDRYLLSGTIENVKGAVTKARFEALRRNRVVGFVWNAGDSQFEVRLHDSRSILPNGWNCIANTTVIDTIDVDEAIAVELIPGTQNIAWAPSGIGTRCDGTSLLGRYELTMGDNASRLCFSAPGRVRVVGGIGECPVDQ